ncbi:endonuclease domain-containing protein [Novosphingobium sp.]|uniref:endonuclease domain-containing protein n=1 Tax=Novosphingobium sp. TaxID=1874826 RepID=UPI00286CB32D|nr:endonuclease domain-containing protein [Novosphingobium sp.]
MRGVGTPVPPRNGEGDRAKRGGGDSRFVARPAVKRARQLRRSMTYPEILLWQRFRQRPLGLKFRRQHAIGDYIVDFYCAEKRYIVEVDGIVHDIGDQPQRDEFRTIFLKDNGYRVLRVAAQRVLADADGTAEAIAARVASPLHRPADGPPPRTGEEHN